MKIIENCKMDEYTSFKVGGECDRLILADTEDELSLIMAKITTSGTPYVVLGNGSNTLFGDGGFRGTVVKLGPGFDKIEIAGDRITAFGAVLMSRLAREAMRAGLGGFEPLSGIPGSVGGAVFMNAGAYGGEMKQVVKRVYAMAPDGSRTGWVSGDDLQLGYRHSRFKDTGEIILKVGLGLVPRSVDSIKADMDDFAKRRNSKQPLEYPSCGSFFKRPPGHYAGSLIQEAGLAGYTIGGAQVSQKHCGFLINRGGATASDVIALRDHVKKTVKEKFGVDLEPEVRIIDEIL
ncbi:MAG: UDP-N-acetylmuramate dehydrogenase [Clostridiales bacterium]|nr:UDP-N-acetylmuramate dehydrogenase [Clostridiales bacterium]MDY4060279.1 UDP-N-acetylmuramate dehydrogenase [Anaerovoracaceae bacterium]